MSDLLTPAELAAMLSKSPRTLANWRSNGRGPKYLKLGPEPPADKQDNVSEMEQLIGEAQ